MLLFCTILRRNYPARLNGPGIKISGTFCVPSLPPLPPFIVFRLSFTPSFLCHAYPVRTISWYYDFNSTEILSLLSRSMSLNGGTTVVIRRRARRMIGYADIFPSTPPAPPFCFGLPTAVASDSIRLPSISSFFFPGSAKLSRLSSNSRGKNIQCVATSHDLCRRLNQETKERRRGEKGQSKSKEIPRTNGKLQALHSTHCLRFFYKDTHRYQSRG